MKQTQDEYVSLRKRNAILKRWWPVAMPAAEASYRLMADRTRGLRLRPFKDRSKYKDAAHPAIMEFAEQIALRLEKDFHRVNNFTVANPEAAQVTIWRQRAKRRPS